MKTTLSLMISLAATLGAANAQTLEIPLWPHGAAQHNGITEPELRRPDWSVTNVSQAAIYVWPADKTRNTGRAMLICPGGGYSNQSANHEGRMPAEWLAAQGVTAIVLKYRLPNEHHDIPLADARQAMHVIRTHAAEWGVDPARVGVMGFSAGGHLASTLLTQYDEGSRPDFGILFYPVVTMTDHTHAGSRRWLLGENPTQELIERFSGERQVTADPPPTLIFFSDDDRSVPPVNGTLFYNALQQAGVRAALHIFPSGGHGWGFKPDFKYHEEMKAALADWLVQVELNRK
jgi:acetyl esterase/lipase